MALMDLFDLAIGFVFGLMFGGTTMLWAVNHDLRRRP